VANCIAPAKPLSPFLKKPFEVLYGPSEKAHFSTED
jgi:hypothetical protein